MVALGDHYVDAIRPSDVREWMAGMAKMSKKFREMGGEVYVDAERVKKSNEALK